MSSKNVFTFYDFLQTSFLHNPYRVQTGHHPGSLDMIMENGRRIEGVSLFSKRISKYKQNQQIHFKHESKCSKNHKFTSSLSAQTKHSPMHWPTLKNWLCVERWTCEVDFAAEDCVEGWLCEVDWSTVPYHHVAHDQHTDPVSDDICLNRQNTGLLHCCSYGISL